MNVRVTVPESDIEQARLECGWTDTRTRVAFALYAAGKSDAEIAALLGGVTRNAVIGKRNREGLLLGVDPTLNARPLAKFDNGGRAGKPRPVRPIVVPRLKRDASPIVDLAIGVEQRRCLAELTDACCHWPVGDPAEPGFFFCGAVVRQADAARPAPYCASHMRRAHVPARRRTVPQAGTIDHAWR